MIYIIMGVSGSGKTTIGKQLSFQLDYHFYDADDLHSSENIKKMSQGIPLNDKDRQPWLLSLSHLINNLQQHQKNAVIACSSLKKSYRQLLQGNHQDLVWIYLKGSFEQILERLNKRKEHFMKSQMLKSQFEDLEEPKNAIILDIGPTPEKIIKQILSNLTVS
ncbi:MAG: gluconokinase [cyanobacterium endosymbiont of Rhopalodia musculus]|uniref:gluconokinase n=1 Tax=cyanobacterium endosymbiont of Epithemia clementina EcSB TaxID=3034674 RepID=UPI0024819252|nr:gluconokinase [cyanobacterium endosymbiont of Epithemia clementina EcSB]WGT67354.1 gluconokinase [cyanobacterium endosymbiont of Epithemia clementina EcSB]